MFDEFLWLSVVYMHAPRIARQRSMDGTVRRLNLLNLLNDTKIIYSVASPLEDNPDKKRRAFNDLVSVFCDWVSRVDVL